MNCEKCDAKNQSHSHFCKSCGCPLPASTVQNSGSVDLYFRNKQNTCQHCGNVEGLKPIKLLKNIGMLVQRQSETIEGRFCRKCIDELFWNFTLTTLVLGWWGTISFFITPFYLLNNVIRYFYSYIDKS
jgi:hypothetical protein